MRRVGLRTRGRQEKTASDHLDDQKIGRHLLVSLEHPNSSRRTRRRQAWQITVTPESVRSAELHMSTGRGMVRGWSRNTATGQPLGEGADLPRASSSRAAQCVATAASASSVTLVPRVSAQRPGASASRGPSCASGSGRGQSPCE